MDRSTVISVFALCTCFCTLCSAQLAYTLYPNGPNTDAARAQIPSPETFPGSLTSETGLTWNISGSASCALPATPAQLLNIAPRIQWGAMPGSGILGYCAEISFQSAGMLFGNWFSEEIVFRANGGSADCLHFKRGFLHPYSNPKLSPNPEVLSNGLR